MHSASPQSLGTTHRWRYSTPGWKRTPSRPLPSAASSAATIGWLCSLVMCPAAKSTMTADRRRRRSRGCSGTRPRRDRARRPSPRPRSARDRCGSAGSKPRIAMLPTSLPAGSPGGITSARPTSARAASSARAACAPLRAACGRRARRAARRHSRRERTRGTSWRRIVGGHLLPARGLRQAPRHQRMGVELEFVSHPAPSFFSLPPKRSPRQPRNRSPQQPTLLLSFRDPRGKPPQRDPHPPRPRTTAPWGDSGVLNAPPSSFWGEPSRPSFATDPLSIRASWNGRAITDSAGS